MMYTTNIVWINGVNKKYAMIAKRFRSGLFDFKVTMVTQVTYCN